MENYQEFYANYEAETRKILKACSDDELIETHNRDTRNGGWGTARAIFTTALRDEILSRDWNAEVLFTRDHTWRIKSYHLGMRVRVEQISGIRTLVQEIN